MEKTPRGMRKHIGIFGDTNAGKSSLINALLGEEQAIVSEQAGTTTDPVSVAMELIPFGPVLLIDTAGSNDGTALAQKRQEKTEQVMRRCDLAIHLFDARSALEGDMPDFQFKGPVLKLLSQADRLSESQRKQLSERYSEALLFSAREEESVEALKKAMIERLEKENTLACFGPMVADLLPEGADVILVIPIDSEAPAGRLILPQVQLMRELLDYGMKAHICREKELASMLQSCKKVDLVVTDSQAFAFVNQSIPRTMLLSSFSMLLARQKGDFEQQFAGAKALDRLQAGDRVLLMEGCKHNANHEDIGRVKIPNLLRKKLGCDAIDFDFRVGYDMPKDISTYRAAILCGSCMISRMETQNRLRLFKEANIPVSNYGLVLANCHGILERTSELFQQRKGL